MNLCYLITFSREAYRAYITSVSVTAIIVISYFTFELLSKQRASIAVRFIFNSRSNNTKPRPCLRE